MTTEDDQFIQVTVNMEKLKDVFQTQSVPIFIGIVASFVCMVVFVGAAIKFKKYVTTFGILAGGALVLFINFILYYVDTTKRQKDIERRLQQARTNVNDTTSQLDCPMYFKHTYDAQTGKNVCKNEYGVGTAEFDKVNNQWEKVSTFASEIPTFSSDKFYPYELAFANVSFASQTT